MNSCGNSECSDDEESHLDNTVTYSKQDMVMGGREERREEKRRGEGDKGEERVVIMWA